MGELANTDYTMDLIQVRDREKTGTYWNPENLPVSFQAEGFHLAWQWTSRNMCCSEHPSFLLPPKGQCDSPCKSCLEESCHFGELYSSSEASWCLSDREDFLEITISSHIDSSSTCWMWCLGD